MSDLYNQIIQPNYIKLLEEVDPRYIVDHLHKYFVIDADEMEKISNKRHHSCRREGTEELLKILRQKGPEAIRIFVSVLGEAGYVELGKQLKISENRPLPEPTSTVLEKHSNRILQLEQDLATLRAKNKAEVENLKSENREMKIQLSTLKAELNVKKETKNQNEYRSQNYETRGQIPTKRSVELTPFELSLSLSLLEQLSAVPLDLEQARDEAVARDEAWEQWLN